MHKKITIITFISYLVTRQVAPLIKLSVSSKYKVKTRPVLYMYLAKLHKIPEAQPHGYNLIFYFI